MLKITTRQSSLLTNRVRNNMMNGVSFWILFFVPILVALEMSD